MRGSNRGGGQWRVKTNEEEDKNTPLANTNPNPPHVLNNPLPHVHAIHAQPFQPSQQLQQQLLQQQQQAPAVPVQIQHPRNKQHQQVYQHPQQQQQHPQQHTKDEGKQKRDRKPQQRDEGRRKKEPNTNKVISFTKQMLPH